MLSTKTQALVREITPGAVVTTYAGNGWPGGYQDGLLASAQFYQPYGVAVGTDSTVYIGDLNNNRIRIIR